MHWNVPTCALGTHFIWTNGNPAFSFFPSPRSSACIVLFVMWLDYQKGLIYWNFFIL